MKTIVLILIYNKLISQSKTLTNLSNFELDCTDLIIFNNGPGLIDTKCDVFNKLDHNYQNVSLQQSIDNLPLSYIYNNFISENDGYDRYIILDDDSDIDYNFFDCSNKFYQITPSDIQLPRVFSPINNSFHYPKVNGLVPEKGFYSELIPGNELLSIGSGLIIFRGLIEKFNISKLQLFDERFALYGVDYSFFRRLGYLQEFFGFSYCIISDINHSLSSMQGEIEPWRKKERLIDHVLTAKYYSGGKIKSYYRVMKLITKEISSLNFNSVFFIFYIFFKGKHPRCCFHGA